MAKTYSIVNPSIMGAMLFILPNEIVRPPGRQANALFIVYTMVPHDTVLAPRN